MLKANFWYMICFVVFEKVFTRSRGTSFMFLQKFKQSTKKLWTRIANSFRP